MKTAEQAAAWLREHDRYLILTHCNPDGDTIGSAAALCLGLRKLGKQAELFPNEQFSEPFLPLCEGLIGSGDPENATVISVDVSTKERVAFSAAHLADEIRLSIDHHDSNTKFAEENLVFPCAACAEIVFRILKALPVELDTAIGERLFVAVSTDTGGFRHPNLTPETFLLGAECLRLGVDFTTWNRVLFTERSLPRLRLEAYLAETTELYSGGKLAISVIPPEIPAKLNARESDLESLSNYPVNIAGVQISALLRMTDRGAKLSMRANPPGNVAELCACFGGGGHAGAAGAVLPGTLEEAKAALLEVLRQKGLLE